MAEPRMDGRQTARFIANEPLMIGRAVVLPGEHFYLVVSPKFAGRCYVVAEKDWMCSSKDEKAAAWCIAQAKAYRQELVARRKASAAA
jgi:hypothetical protein